MKRSLWSSGQRRGGAGSSSIQACASAAGAGAASPCPPNARSFRSAPMNGSPHGRPPAYSTDFDLRSQALNALIAASCEADEEQHRQAELARIRAEIMGIARDVSTLRQHGPRAQPTTRCRTVAARPAARHSRSANRKSIPRQRSARGPGNPPSRNSGVQAQGVMRSSSARIDMCATAASSRRCSARLRTSNGRCSQSAMNVQPAPVKAKTASNPRSSPSRPPNRRLQPSRKM